MERLPSNILERAIGDCEPGGGATRNRSPPARRAKDAEQLEGRGTRRLSSRSGRSRVRDRAHEWQKPFACSACRRAGTGLGGAAGASGVRATMSGEFGNPATRRESGGDRQGQRVASCRLDPEVSMSYTALAAVQAYHDWDFAAAERTLRQGIEAFPRGAIAHGRLAPVTRGDRTPAGGGDGGRTSPRSGALDPGTAYNARHYPVLRARLRSCLAGDATRARDLSKLRPGVLWFGSVLSAAGRHDEAIRSIRSAIDLSPNVENPAWLAGRRLRSPGPDTLSRSMR